MNFDLSVDNYNQDELKDILNLPAQYTTSDIERNESILRNSILNNQNINKETQTKTLFFLTDVKNRLIANENGFGPSRIIDFINNSYKMKTTTIEDPSEHMVQVRQETPYLSSSPSEYFPGIINPLKRRTIKRNLNIDSRFRENYSSSLSSNFNVVLPMIINNVFTMQLSSIELPISYYVLSNLYGNNFFSLKIDGGDTYLITIPEGNYTNTSIIAAINTVVAEVLTNAKITVTITFSVDIDATNNSGTAKTKVTSFPSTTFELNFQTDRLGNEDKGIPLPLKFGWLLGFRKGTYLHEKSYVSEGIICVSPSRYIYLVVDDFNNNVNNGFYSAFHSSLLNKNILARISLQPVASFETFAQSNLNIVTTPREYFGPVNINNLNIQLLDEYGRIMDLNFMDFSFCLTLTLRYDI
jgi:hypothetical protein